MAFDEERLQRLLGGSELVDLRRRLRIRYEKGAARDEFTLTDLKAIERRALAGLLGRPTLVADSMRILVLHSTRRSRARESRAHFARHSSSSTALSTIARRIG